MDQKSLGGDWHQEVHTVMESDRLEKPRQKFGALASHGAVLTFAAAICVVMYYLAVLPMEQDNILLRRENGILVKTKGELEAKVAELDAMISLEQDRRKAAEKRVQNSQKASTSNAEQIGTLQGQLTAKQTELDLARINLTRIDSKAHEDGILFGDLKRQVSSLDAELEMIRNDTSDWRTARKELEKTVSELQERLKAIGNMNADEFMRSREATAEHWEELAKSEAVQHDYTPFLSKSMFRLGSKDKKFDEGHPESLENLRRLGALQDHRSFAQVGAGFRPHQPRGMSRGYQIPHIGRTMWPLPDNTAEFNTYKNKFEDFLKLGPIWVRMGILDK